MLRRKILQGAGALALTGAGAQVPMAAAAATGGSSAASGATEAHGPYDWKNVPYGAGGFVDGFVFHQREKGLLYARTDVGGAYRFDAGTNGWVPLLDHLAREDGDLMGVLSLALDPNDTSRVYAACGLYTGEWARGAALLVSDDRGEHWQIRDLGIKLGGNEGGRGTGERLQVDPHQSDILLLGTTRDGLMRSKDRGVTFKKLDFAPRHVSLVLIDPASAAPGTASRSIYVGSHDQPGLYVSHDGGQSFAREAGTPEQVPQHAVFDHDRTLYVTFARGDSTFATNPGNATTGGVWKRDRSGSWTEISPMRPDASQAFGYSGLDVDRRQPGRLIVSTIERWGLGDDLYMSTDAGATWAPIGNQSHHDGKAYPWLSGFLRGQDRMGHWISDVKIDPYDSERVVYGTGYGLWITKNLSAVQKSSVVQWDFAVANMELATGLEIRSPAGGATLLGAMGSVGGSAWDNVDATPRAGMFTPTSENNRSVDFAALKPAVLARTSDECPTGGYWSTNGSVSWRPFGPSPRRANPSNGRFGPSGDVAVSAQGSFFVWAPEKEPALWSQDQGRTWAESTGWPATRDVALKPVADRFVEGVFYVHDRANGQVLVSVDGGKSFAPSFVGLPKLQGWQSAQLICAPGAMRDLWLALPDVLLHFPAGGQPTKTIRNVVEPWLVAVGKGAAGGTYHSLFVWGKVRIGSTEAQGLFRSDDAGASFVRIDDDRHRYGALVSLTADPLEHGTVYVAPHGRGIVRGKPRAAL
jgi:photosystem II stability/assembly factor-like uncharacterized protein